jgi:hypothetical protein
MRVSTESGIAIPGASVVVIFIFGDGAAHPGTAMPSADAATRAAVMFTIVFI